MRISFRGLNPGKSVKGGHSPRYCNRRRIPEKATALRGGKAGDEADPKVRIPGLNLQPALFFGRKKSYSAGRKIPKAGGKENE